MEAVDNELSKVLRILSNIQAFNVVGMNCIEDVVLVGFEVSDWEEVHVVTLVIASKGNRDINK